MKEYPMNPRYIIGKDGVVIDAESGEVVPHQYTPKNKKYVKMLADDGTYHTVYLVYALALTYCGARPSPDYHAVLIDPANGYRADNVRWQSEQEKNQKKIKINQINKILELKSVDELKQILSMLSPDYFDYDFFTSSLITECSEKPDFSTSSFLNEYPEKPKKSIEEIFRSGKKSKK